MTTNPRFDKRHADETPASMVMPTSIPNYGAEAPDTTS